MRDAGLNLAGIGLITAGGILTYTGVNDPVGGPIGVLRDLLTGRTPSPGVRTVTGTETIGEAPFSETGGELDAQHGGLALGAKRRVVSVAEGFLGTRYLLGGSSKSGIDCSGLVMVAYRQGAGISLPHRATAQAARGRAVPRQQAEPGDLVAWGVPGNYPHIAIVTGANTCIAAWTWGVPVKYGPIDQKAVPGFGYPDIIKIIG
jgi:cell wall-associated NlpC family hydrolase